MTTWITEFATGTDMKNVTETIKYINTSLMFWKWISEQSNFVCGVNEFSPIFNILHVLRL
jgi:hypothetical protein